MKITKEQKDVEKWWDEISEYYEEELADNTPTVADYGPFSQNEKELKLLGSVRGKKILELGCGGGQCSIAFAKQGAICTGIDLSKEQLKYAEKLAKKNKVNVKFMKGDIQTLENIKDSEYDIVFSSFAYQYVPNLKLAFKEVYRVLRKDGLFVFSLDHPFSHIVFFYFDKNRKWSYYRPGKTEKIETFPDGSKHKFVIYSRKVSDIYNALLDAGFLVSNIIEPFSLKKGRRWVKNYSKKIIKLIGPTIIFKARKK